MVAANPALAVFGADLEKVYEAHPTALKNVKTIRHGLAVRKLDCFFEMCNRRSRAILLGHSLAQLPPRVGIFGIESRRTPCSNNCFVDSAIRRLPLYGHRSRK